jgi:hypothetical protein
MAVRLSVFRATRSVPVRCVRSTRVAEVTWRRSSRPRRPRRRVPIPPAGAIPPAQLAGMP